jgi:hypothetical protein
VRIGGDAPLAKRSTFLQEALVSEVAFANGELTGRTLAQIQTADTKRLPHTVTLSLFLQGDSLRGSAMAVSVFENRWSYALPHWVELTKAGSLFR